MERTMSVEEKIRRAEEIYERRKQGNAKPIATVSVREKKDVKLLKKMIIQILVCVSIYLVIYTIQNSNYVFSEEFLKKVNEILSYDTNFSQIYENVKKQIMNWIPKQEENKQEGIGGAEETTQQMETQDSQEQSIEEQNQETQEETTQDAQQPLSPEEQDIQNTKNTASFIKPVQGTISSQFGKRENATGSVPKNHTGTDIAANTGTKIISATDGEVVLASEEGDFGKHLKIQIGEVSVIYAHCNTLYVKQGDFVKQGQEIAEVGSTGNSTRTTFTL